MDEVPRLVEVQDRYRNKGVRVVGVTEADRTATEQFAIRHPLNYPLLADAAVDRDAYGIDVIWGSEIYLVDPSGNIVARGMDDASARLAAEFS